MLSVEEDAAIFSEVAIMANLNHPNISKVIDFFEENGFYFIILEFFEGGDLHDRIGRRKVYNENDARNCIAILLDAIDYFHTNSVAHLDLKTENLVLTSENNDTKIKLVDFGYSQHVLGRNSLTGYKGTPYFVAPEIIRREPYDERAEMWSIGVITYILLSGEHPFSGTVTFYRNVLREKVEFKGSIWNNVSQDAKKLILGLLDKNPNTRFTAKQAISGPWLKQKFETSKIIDLNDSLMKRHNRQPNTITASQA